MSKALASIAAVFILLCNNPSLLSQERSIGILCNPQWSGEHSFALRLQSAAANLGWKVYFLNSIHKGYTKHEYDWILTLDPDVAIKMDAFHAQNYLVLFDPINHYFDASYCISNKFANFTGYLKTFEEPIFFKRQQDLLVYPHPWYPSAQNRPYKLVIPQKLFHFVGQWGNRCNNKYKRLEAQLAETEYTHIFGCPFRGAKYRDAYKGRIPFNSESIQDKISELGVCLVFHSDIHIAHGIPSGRIFEAASAAAVIISDMNPFVQKYFGDSVLYVDQNGPWTQMYKQIDAHMQWILTHQEEAQEMAKRAYEIFRDRFLLEKQLLEFDAWHQSISK